MTLLAIGPVAFLFAISVITVGAVIAKEVFAEATAPRGHKRRPEEGKIVSAKWVNGSEWIVKVYYSKLGYEAQVLYAGEYQDRKTGFPTQAAAEAWGFQYARDRGA